MARAVRISEYGGPEVMHVVDIDMPVPGAGEVTIEVKAAGVNPVDWKVRAGGHGAKPITEPRGLGTDVAGVIVAVGPDVTDYAVGDEVIARGLNEAYASHVLALSSRLTRKPATLGWAEAAALGVPAGTAYQVLKSLGLRSGETLLVHAGSGAVGQAAIQLARHWGATVVATASEANQTRLAQLGAVPVTYGPGLVDRVRKAAPGGVDVVLDAAGTDEAIDASLELVADRSRIATVVNVDRALQSGFRVWSGSRPGLMTPEAAALRLEAVGLRRRARGEGRIRHRDRRQVPARGCRGRP